MKVLITGGVGFVGTNAAKSFLEQGWEVVIFDNCLRPGSDHNLADLGKCGEFELVKADIRDTEAVDGFAQEHADADFVIHLAAQVAVTHSVLDPRHDFAVNALGTLNLLESLRKIQFAGLLLYTSTNKVYGKLEHVPIAERLGGYSFRDLDCGVDETMPLDFYAPYACSKGSADQYVRDYSRIFGLRTTVFRMSCIFGPHQYGTDDQGWVAWFIIAALTDRSVSVYGDGKQVRDVLFVEDLIDAFIKAYEHVDSVDGQVFNIGGGPDNRLSVLGLINMLQDRLKPRLRYSLRDWRAGDQRIYVSDVRKTRGTLGWQPSTTVDAGLDILINWARENKKRFI